jgi:hypothetical protein
MVPFWFFFSASRSAAANRVVIVCVEALVAYLRDIYLKMLFDRYTKATMGAFVAGDIPRARMMSERVLSVGSRLDMSLRVPLVLALMAHGRRDEAACLAYSATQDARDRVSAGAIVAQFWHR